MTTFLWSFHHAADPACSGCISGFPVLCSCGGLIHAGYDDVPNDDGLYVATDCDRCRREMSAEEVRTIRAGVEEDWERRRLVEEMRAIRAEVEEEWDRQRVAEESRVLSQKRARRLRRNVVTGIVILCSALAWGVIGGVTFHFGLLAWFGGLILTSLEGCWLGHWLARRVWRRL